jgi:glycosyltransferase involved in cell wall biosynthesis
MKNIASVIICTYNRYGSLQNTLKSLINQRTDGVFDYEVLVIDNNSSDSTHNVVNSFLDKFNGRLKYAFEPRQGKSYALNRGVELACGDIVITTDDDCIVHKDWLYYIIDTFRRNNADLVGGKILPYWPCKPPKWIYYSYIIGKLSLLNFGDSEIRILSRNQDFNGCNMGFKKDELVKAGLFNINLGRKGTQLLAGEETELFYKFFDSGKIIYYQPNAVIYHTILPERFKKSFFRKRCFDGGKTVVRLKKVPNTGPLLFNIPLYIVKSILLNSGLWLKNIFLFNIERRFFYELEMAYDLGRIYEYLVKLNK